MRFPSGLQALDNIDAAVAPGEFVAIVGPSGCGKSTLLRIVAGLITPTGGTCARSATARRPSSFKSGATAVAHGSEERRTADGTRRYAPAERTARAAEALKLVGLAGFERAYPHSLSGGMRMRLSLARVIALKPRCSCSMSRSRPSTS